MSQLLRRFVSGRHGLVCGLLAVAAVAVAPPAAVAASAQSDNHFANADGLIRAGDIPGAVIELEKAIDADPGNLEAWLALGKSRIWLGAPRQAEATLNEARERGLAEARMIVPLAQALLMQAKFDEVLGDIRSGQRGAKVEGEILLIRGQAQMNLGLIDDAETSLRRAIGLRPDDPRPKIVLAQLLISKGALSAAERLAEAALLLAPQASEVWVLKGELRRLADDLDGAVDYFSRALDIDPSDMAARLDRAASLIDLDRDAEAASDLEAILRFAPDHPPTLYLTALLAAKRKEYKAAEAALGAGGRQLRDHLPSIFLRASIFYAQDRLDEAAAELTRYLRAIPGHIVARKMLGSTYIRNQQADAAIETLTPLAVAMSNDPQTLALLGSAYMLDGQFSKSTTFFERAAAAAPDAGAIRAQLGLSRLATGQSSRAVGDLESAVALSPTKSHAGILLTLVHLRNQDFDAALEAAGELVRRLPDNPLALNLKGTAERGRGDLAAARRDFERAIALDADYLPARISIARLAAVEGDAIGAEEGFQSVLQRQSDHVEAMTGLARLAIDEGRVGDAVVWLQKARDADRRAVAPRLELINLYLGLRDGAQALEVARELRQAVGETPESLDALARARIGVGDAAGAIGTYRRLVALTPKSAEVLHRLAAAQTADKDDAGARRSLHQAIDVNPAYVPARVASIELELRTGHRDTALAYARALSAEPVTAGLGAMLVGDVLMDGERYAEAAEAYARASAAAPSARIAVRLFNARNALGDSRGALAPLERWVGANSGDDATRFLLATALVDAGRFAPAIVHHETLLAGDPGNALVLTGLAVAYHEIGDRRALDYAERAYGIAPQLVWIADTLGWILVREGEAERGAGVLREASAKVPGEPRIHYRLAVALNALGRSDEARRELETALGADKPFNDAAAARSLLKSLTGS